MPQDVYVDADYTGFVRRARTLANVDLSGYKPEQMRRRLLALAQRHGANSLAQLAALMERDANARAAFKNFFTINVSEFLRDPARWDDLARRILPEIRRDAGGRQLRIWSAGCSHGAEPYSLAMLLEELAPGQPYTVIATDIDEAILARARAGRGYTEADVRQVDAGRRGRFFVRESDGTYTVREHLRARVRFVQQDLLAAVPGRDFDLIVCRNVVIYFTDDAKRALYERLHAALRSGGVLFVGGTEIVPGARELGLEPVLTSFYRAQRREQYAGGHHQHLHQGGRRSASAGDR